MNPPSPRNTAPGHTDDRAPTSTDPMITASGCTNAASLIVGSRSPSA
jgi:hypothetical protein